MRHTWGPIIAVVSVIVGICAFVGVFASMATHYSAEWSRNIDAKSCALYSKQTGRQTKFVDYTHYSWDCLTPSRDGKWISTDSLVEVVKSNG